MQRARLHRRALLFAFALTVGRITYGQPQLQSRSFFVGPAHPVTSNTAFTAAGQQMANGVLYVRTNGVADSEPYSKEPNWVGVAFPNADAWGWIPVTTAGDGTFAVVMPLPRGYSPGAAAGINEVIQVAGVPFQMGPYAGSCAPSAACYQSDVFTSWRRVYIESDRMFKRGAFLRTSPVAGATKVDVTSALPFQNASGTHPIPVLFIHSPDASVTGDAAYMEAGNAVRVKGNNPAVLTLDQPLVHSYTAVDARYAPGLYAGDAVGVYVTDGDLFPAEFDLAQSCFATFDTDVHVLSGSENLMPYLPFVQNMYESHLLWRGVRPLV